MEFYQSPPFGVVVGADVGKRSHHLFAVDAASGEVLLDESVANREADIRAARGRLAGRGPAEGVSDQARLQAKLLAAASSRVAPGGHLVYSTCSVLAEENRCVVDAFLASEAGRAFSRVRDDLQTIPASGSCDGHFCAVLKRD